MAKTTKPQEELQIVAITCPEEGCNSRARGYDIERAYDRDNSPVYAVFYECEGDSHRFVCEYDRIGE